MRYLDGSHRKSILSPPPCAATTMPPPRDSLHQHRDGHGPHTRRHRPSRSVRRRGRIHLAVRRHLPPDLAVVKVVSIQQRAVMPIITVRGIIAQAQSGAGKTSMISLFVYQVIETNVHEVQALAKTWTGASLTGRTCSWTAIPWLPRSTTSGLSCAFRVPLKNYTQVSYSWYRP